MNIWLLITSEYVSQLLYSMCISKRIWKCQTLRVLSYFCFYFLECCSKCVSVYMIDFSLDLLVVEHWTYLAFPICTKVRYQPWITSPISVCSHLYHTSAIMHTGAEEGHNRRSLPETAVCHWFLVSLWVQDLCAYTPIKYTELYHTSRLAMRSCFMFHFVSCFSVTVFS